MAMDINGNSSNNGAGGEFQEDPHVPDRSDELLEVFGPTADWPTEMAKLSEPASAKGQETPGVEAPAPGGSSAAEGGQSGASQQGQQGQDPAIPQSQQQDGGASQQSQAQPQQSGGQQPTPAPAQAPASPSAPQGQQPAPAQAAPNPEVQSLKAQVEALTALLQKHQNQPQGTQPAASGHTQAQPQQPPAEDLSKYALSIPSDVLGALSDTENPQMYQAGLHHLVNSLATVVHQRIMQHVGQTLDSRFGDFQSKQQALQTQTQMQQEYFTSFPAHSSPAIRLIVAQEAEAMWGQNPTLGWDENSRNALGARVNARLGIQAQQPQQPAADPNPQQPGTGTQPAPAPAAQFGATTRPAPVSDIGAEISAVLG